MLKSNLPIKIRSIAYEELCIFNDIDITYEPDMPVKEQIKAIEAIEVNLNYLFSLFNGKEQRRTMKLESIIDSTEKTQRESTIKSTVKSMISDVSEEITKKSKEVIERFGKISRANNGATRIIQFNS